MIVIPPDGKGAEKNEHQAVGYADRDRHSTVEQEDLCLIKRQGDREGNRDQRAEQEIGSFVCAKLGQEEQDGCDQHASGRGEPEDP